MLPLVNCPEKSFEEFLLTSSPLTAEYNNSGAGSEGTRASFASNLNEPVLITEVLGSDYEDMAYVDPAYLA